MFVNNLNDVSCPNCDNESLIWWEEDETESIIEIYVDCGDCGMEYPKQIVNKSDDTSFDRLEKVASKHF